MHADPLTYVQIVIAKMPTLKVSNNLKIQHS